MGLFASWGAVLSSPLSIDFLACSFVLAVNEAMIAVVFLAPAAFVVLGCLAHTRSPQRSRSFIVSPLTFFSILRPTLFRAFFFRGSLPYLMYLSYAVSF